MKENLMIIFGGRSVEHDISIITALQTISIAKKEHNVTPLYISKEGKWYTGEKFDEVDTFIDFEKANKKEVGLICGKKHLYVKKFGKYKKTIKVDTALLCLHGGEGEGGAVAGLLSMCKIPFSSSEMTSSAICMDKIFAKDILSANKINNVPYIMIRAKDFESDSKQCLKKVKKFGYPVIIKPANLGSSVAIEIVRKESELKEKLEVAFDFDDRVLVERYLEDSQEFNCACMTDQDDVVCSKVIEVQKTEIFTFDEKYLKNGEENLKKPKNNVKKVQNTLKKLAKQVYETLDCKGVVRIDFLIKDDVIYVNEINSIPGSLSMHMFGNYSRREIVDVLVKSAKDKFAKKRT